MHLCHAITNISEMNSDWSRDVRASLYSLMSLIILATLVGNLIVIISISHFKQLHTPTNWLLHSTAVVDFLLGCLVMPYSMVRTVERCWYFGEIFCKVHTSIDITLSSASIFHLAFISIDRYCAVYDPLRYKAKIKVSTIFVMILVSWSLPAVFAFGMIFLELNLKGAEEELYYNQVGSLGGCSLFFSKISGILAFIASFYIPGSVMLFVYYRIYFIAKGQARSINRRNLQVGVSEGKSREPHSKETKAAKTLGIMMGVFLACWCPFFFCTALNPFLGYVMPPSLNDALNWFGYLNSALNPLVYAFFYPWFRRALKMVLFGKIFQKDSSRSKLFL